MKIPLPDDSIEKWVYREHIKVKHEILGKYLEGWIRILGGIYDLNIFDCFAGRGEYIDNEGNFKEGSPLVILKKLAEVRERMNRPEKASCIFIEKNNNNFMRLRALINEEMQDNPGKYEGWLWVDLYNDEFGDVAMRILSKYRDKLAPSFFFVDPFGFGIPFKIIADILSIEKTEVFINFMVRDVNRFLESPRHEHSIEDLYGTSNVPEELSKSYPNLPREQALLKLYRKQLHEAGNVKYTFPFKVNADDRLQTTYYLIHCTNHPKGCELMKTIMYGSGTEGRFGYLGPAEGQISLTYFDGESLLKDFLLRRFAGRTLLHKNVRYETLMETDFVAKHYRKAIKELYEEDKVHIEGMGKRGGLPDNARITFKC